MVKVKSITFIYSVLISKYTIVCTRTCNPKNFILIPRIYTQYAIIWYCLQIIYLCMCYMYMDRCICYTHIRMLLLSLVDVHMNIRLGVQPIKSMTAVQTISLAVSPSMKTDLYDQLSSIGLAVIVVVGIIDHIILSGPPTSLCNPVTPHATALWNFK